MHRDGCRPVRIDHGPAVDRPREHVLALGLQDTGEARRRRGRPQAHPAVAHRAVAESERGVVGEVQVATVVDVAEQGTRLAGVRQRVDDVLHGTAVPVGPSRRHVRLDPPVARDQLRSANVGAASCCSTAQPRRAALRRCRYVVIRTGSTARFDSYFVMVRSLDGITAPRTQQLDWSICAFPGHETDSLLRLDGTRGVDGAHGCGIQAARIRAFWMPLARGPPDTTGLRTGGPWRRRHRPPARWCASRIVRIQCEHVDHRRPGCARLAGRPGRDAGARRDRARRPRRGRPSAVRPRPRRVDRRQHAHGAPRLRAAAGGRAHRAATRTRSDGAPVRERVVRPAPRPRRGAP